MDDLFMAKKPNKHKLLEWILSKNWVSTSDVIQWGVKNYSNRALRDAQQMASEGLFRRMTDQEKARVLFSSQKQDYWVRNDFR